jgi:hypothetical protein
MSSATVRISEKGHKILKELAQQDNKAMPEVLDALLEAERQRRFFEGINAGYEAMRSDPVAWKEELAERALLDNTLLDGLKPDEK